ncbi:unnamed protein product [Blepharisma stoltei]|uniref:Uncharacterized protein n=1 Tax=Blepharisma stoltei TaxID=1481888 RepID=A0AAU9JZP6_9CILI|nr:unnamed protein product [Blepharisma stoltei]
MWEIARRIKRAMRSKPVSFTKGEEEEMIKWWKLQYDDREWDWGKEGDPKIPTRPEVENAIGSLSNRKAVGPDGVSSELIKYGGEAATEMYWGIIMEIWQKRTLPKTMKCALVVYKKTRLKETGRLQTDNTT